MINYDYPNVADRVKAIFTDMVFLIVLMFVFSNLFEQFEKVPDYFRGIAFVFVFLLYDPLLTSLTGGTLGHKMNGLQVKRENDETRNISIVKAFIRFLLKSSLGWLSFLTMSVNSKRKAFHDMMVGSVVIYSKKA